MIGYKTDADIRSLTLHVDGSAPLTPESVAELVALCNQAEEADGTRAVILQVSGVPGPEWSSGLTVALVSKWERALRRLERLPAITIAVAVGDCGGCALDALMAADYRIMTLGAQIILATVADAIWPGMALYRLVRQAAGAAPARQAVLFGTPIGATKAQAMGLIDEVPSNVALARERGRKVAESAASAPGAEFAVRRQLMLEAISVSFDEALGPHLAACDRTLRMVPAGRE